MHRGCFVWTPTAPLSGRTTPRPGPARVCMCVPCLARSGGPASRARSGVPQLSFGRSWCLLCWFDPSGLGLPCLWLLLVLFFFPLPPLLRPLCVLLCLFSGLGCLGPWRLVAPPPAPLFFPRPPAPLRPVVSRFACFPASGALGLGILSPPPPFFSFVTCFFFFCFFLFLFCRFCGAGGVCVSWAVRCVRVCLGGAVPVVALCALAGVVWCWMLGLAVLCCLLLGLGVVFWWCCPCLAAWLAALWFGLVCLCVPLPCVVFCCAAPSCGGVLSRSAVCLRSCLCLLFVSCRCAPALCVLGCRAVCSLSSQPCAVLCCAVLVPFRRAVRVVCAVSGGWCCWFLVSLPFVGGLLVALVARRCRLVVCVGFGAPVWSGCRSASFLWCHAPLFCVLWRCAAVWCWAVLPFFFVFLLAGGAGFHVVPCWFWAPGRLKVVSVSVLCLCGAVLVCLRRCSLCGALLPLRGWLVLCVVACCVCVFAVGPGCPLLSPGWSWWLLVPCLGGVRWCVLGCCAAPCCCVLCRLALRCCALPCFFLHRLVLPRAVLCPGALSVVLGSCAFWRRVLSCPPALCAFCCGVLLRGVVCRCALCRLRPGVSCCAFPVVSALCGVAVWPALPRCPAPLCCAPWCIAAAWCRGVVSWRLVGFVSCVGVVLPT